jgi:hypothetical protein
LPSSRPRPIGLRASRQSASASLRNSARPAPSCAPPTPPTSPGRTCCSTAARSPGRSEDRPASSGRVGKAKRAHHNGLTAWARREERAFAHPTGAAMPRRAHRIVNA